MKYFFRIILKYYLKYITKLVLAIHRPFIIAIAGSSNKSFIRDEIKKIIEAKGKTVRANPKSFNTEIGLPLAILNIDSGYNSYKAWIPVIFSAVRAIFQKNFPRYLVLELGVSRRGDMRHLLSIIKPSISIVAEINQRYIESFSGMDNLVSEYVYLVKKTKSDGTVILNHDNPRVRSLAEKSEAKVKFFGKYDEKGIYKIEKIEKQEAGQKFWLKHGNEAEELSIRRFGEHNVIAAAVGRIFEEM